MKTHTLTLCALLAVVGGAFRGAAQESGEPSRPLARPVRAERVEAKARALEAQGRHEQAERMQREVRPLSEPPARGPERAQARPELRGRPGAPAPWEAQLKQMATRLERSLAETREHQAAQLQKHFRRLEELLSRFTPPHRSRPESEHPRAGLEAGRGPTPERAEIQRRLEHLTAAIENLHAAGLPEFAERLAPEREELARHLEGPAVGRAPLAELRRLRAELDEVRESLRRLEAHVEELHRDRR